MSLPDEPEEQDAPLIAALESGDAWTTDMHQAARLAGMGYTVKRRDRHVEGHLIETALSADVLDLSIDRGFEMRGDRDLNRPNVDVVAPPPMESDRSETGKLMSGCSPTSCSPS